MKLPKKYIEILLQILNKTELSLTDSRIRDSFMKELLETAKTYDSDRQKILNEYCEKDEDNKPIIEDNKFKFNEENIIKANEELAILLEETVELKSDDKLKSIIEQTKYTPKFGEVEVIDEILKLI